MVFIDVIDVPVESLLVKLCFLQLRQIIDTVNFLSGSWCSAVFWIWDENNGFSCC